jgi:tetratricopeptide (TPR) repeat protein/predicted aspartyl protease
VFDRTHRRAAFLLILFVHLPLGVLAADCKLAKLADLPVTMDGLRPTVTAQINGTPALFTLDSGAFWSMLTPAAAAEYKLRLDRTRLPNLYVEGVGGRVDAAVTTVATFTIFGVPIHNVDFIVGGSEPGRSTVGLLGQNMLRIADIEYDLAQGVIRLFRARDCKRTVLAYWLEPGVAFSQMDIEWATPQSPHTTGTAYLNSAKIHVTFDSGAAASIVGLRAAASAGFKPDGPGVVPAGYDYGIGRRQVRTWIATFPSLKIGDEEVRNARLRFGDIGNFDMLLGSDFFLSHRIYVASSQRKLYFTYNGGPVFKLPAPQNTATAAEGTTDPTPATAPAATGDSTPNAGAPADAPGLARRAAALAARHDFEHAQEEYTRACELAPNEPAYYYQRALVRFALRQSENGSSDIDQALKLKPDYVDALVARAQVRVMKQDAAGAVADLDAVDRIAPKEADIRLRLAGIYERLDRLPPAIAELDLWIAVHSQDVHLADALNSRCWARAQLGEELDRALSDCNAGLRLDAHSAKLLDSRGLVFLRKGNLDKAIADYDAALQINPKIPWSLYGRGVAKLRKGMTGPGEADLAAAAAIAPRLSERAKRLGIVP